MDEDTRTAEVIDLVKRFGPNSSDGFAFPDFKINGEFKSDHLQVVLRKQDVRVSTELPRFLRELLECYDIPDAASVRSDLLLADTPGARQSRGRNKGVEIESAGPDLVVLRLFW